MAKNIGVIQFTGKLGNVSGRMVGGENILQSPGGFKSDRVKTEARYEPTRQLYSEFGRCATLASMFRRQLDFYIRLLPDPYVYNHIQKLMASIKSCDIVSSKGERNVHQGLLTAGGATLLQSFSFNRQPRFYLHALGQHDVDMADGKLNLPDIPAKAIVFPAGATWAGMQLIVLAVDFDAAECTVAKSEMVFIQKKSAVTDLLLDAGEQDRTKYLVAVLFIGFCKDEKEPLWLRHGNTALQIIGAGRL